MVKKRTTVNFTYFLFYLQCERQNSAKFTILGVKIQKKIIKRIGQASYTVVFVGGFVLTCLGFNSGN